MCLSDDDYLWWRLMDWFIINGVWAQKVLLNWGLALFYYRIFVRFYSVLSWLSKYVFGISYNMSSCKSKIKYEYKILLKDKDDLLEWYYKWLIN
jgi:hypothetical protein